MQTPRKAPILRRLRKAKPPRALMHQKMCDEKRRLSMNIGNYLVLLEEGTAEQVSLAKQRAKSELLKIGQEMEKLAADMGDKYTQLLREFLDSIEGILYAATDWVDEAKVTRYFNAEQKFEKTIHKD